MGMKRGGTGVVRGRRKKGGKDGIKFYLKIIFKELKREEHRYSQSKRLLESWYLRVFPQNLKIMFFFFKIAFVKTSLKAVAIKTHLVNHSYLSKLLENDVVEVFSGPR